MIRRGRGRVKKLYLVTGATGHLGTVLCAELRRRGEAVRALVLPGEEGLLPAGVSHVRGDVTAPDSLPPFFDRAGYERVTLIHCAALITIASRPDPRLWPVNVEGTDHVMRLALEKGVERVIYVSSVHAIPERAPGETVGETDSFSPETVHGQYAKSKAAAARLVLGWAGKGLPVSIVHPSGIIGPGDLRRTNHSVNTLRAMASGRIPCAIRGGYDFVDARDAALGILGCEEGGRPGECYILSGEYLTVRKMLNAARAAKGKRPVRIVLPHALARLAAPLSELLSRVRKSGTPLLTPYSVYTLHKGERFSHEKARQAFGYSPRPALDAIRDSLD